MHLRVGGELMWKRLQTCWPAGLKGGAARGAMPVLPQGPQMAGEPCPLSKRIPELGNIINSILEMKKLRLEGLKQFVRHILHAQYYLFIQETLRDSTVCEATGTEAHPYLQLGML